MFTLVLSIMMTVIRTDAYAHAEDNAEENGGASPISIHQGNEAEKEIENIPTLQGVAQIVAKEEKTRLDKKQCIMYEILACSFLLDLICGENDADGSFGLEQLLNHALGEEGHSEITALVEQLEKRG